MNVKLSDLPAKERDAVRNGIFQALNLKCKGVGKIIRKQDKEPANVGAETNPGS